MTYTVKQLSRLAGVSVRTLHYYDAIGLLEPDSIRPNGYREYGDAAVLKLQQILFYRELDLSLEAIKSILNRPDFDAVTALEEHRISLQGRAARLEHLVRTVNDTINHLKGLKPMNQKQLFAAFSDEEQEKYALEAEQMYDPAIVKESNRKFKALSEVEKQRIFDEGNQIYTDMVDAMPKGADSPEVQAIIERWRKHMEHFWTPSLQQLEGLAGVYTSDPRFKANFDKIDGRLAEFMVLAVKTYVKTKSK
ncbi:MAG TPA: MerR family transcriptional regulator [Anaerolineales bacterium]|nr:MerR family transcriptional regulator [Anaerolineales bacterium]